MRRYLGLIGVMLLVLMLAGCRATAVTAPTVTTAPTDETASVNPERPQAVNFDLATPEGTRVRLEDFRGKLVVLNFWATWCPTCRAEMDSLELYYQNHRDDGVVVIGINYKESAQAVSSFVAARALTFPFVLDEEGKVAAAYGLVGLPASYFIDCQGGLIGFWPGAVTAEWLEQKLTPFLAECEGEK